MFYYKSNIKIPEAQLRGVYVFEIILGSYSHRLICCDPSLELSCQVNSDEGFGAPVAQWVKHWRTDLAD